MKRILCAALCAAMLCSVIVSGTGAADEPFGQKSDSLILYDEALGYYKGVAEKTSADAFAAEFTSSVEVKNPAGETVAGDTFVGSDFSVIDGTVSRKILVYGDVNRDGVINLKDVSAMIRKSAGMSVDLCEAAFDVTLDGTNNMKDIGRVIRSLAGWDVELGYIPWTLDLDKVDASAEDETLELYFTGGTVKYSPDDEEAIPNGVYSYQMHLARNEAEQCNAYLYSYIGHEGLNATLTDFTDKFGNTLETTFLWTDYFEIKTNGAVEPERLPPIENDFSLDVNSAQGLFIKAKAGADAPAGLYRAVLQITGADNNVIKKAYVYAEVWDFTLPEASSAKTAFGMSAYHIYVGQGVSEDPGRELYTKYYEYLLDNRINAWCMPFDPVTDEANEYMSDPRVNTFLVAGGYGGDMYGGDKTGEDVAAAYEKLSQNEEWASKAIFYLDDEPLSAAAINAVKEHQSFLDTYYPGARSIVPFPIDDDYDTSDTFDFLAQYTTVLCPCSRLYPGPEVQIDGVINHYSQALQDKYGVFTDRVEKYRSEGKEIWWYTGGYSPLSPMTNIGPMNSAMENRLMFWEQYKYDVEGYLYWSSVEWDGLGSRNRKQISGNAGIMVYCGKPFGISGPIACLRAEIVRDGIEDYEYLTLAEKYLGEDKANEYLSKIVTDINHFERDENVLEQVRLELGYALEEAMAEGK